VLQMSTGKLRAVAVSMSGWFLALARASTTAQIGYSERFRKNRSLIVSGHPLHVIDHQDLDGKSAGL
jgi:hypothetical protein